MKKTAVLLLLLLFVTVQTAGATVVDTKAPYFGDFLFVYNNTDADVTLSPQVSDSLKNTLTMSRMSDADECVEERIHWSPDCSDLSLPTGFATVTPASVQKTPILFALFSPDVGDTVTYLVSNPLTGTGYNQDFIYMATGQYCNIMVEPDAEGTPKISAEDAQKIATEFDNHIQPFMVENFGDYYTYLGTKYAFVNGRIQEVLDGVENTKMNILLYDIQDGYNGTTNRSYVGGYTSLSDFISENLGGNGNEQGILHIDIYPLMGTSGSPDVTKAYSTIVHEFQHQISYSDSLFDYFRGATSYYINDTWWNEAFSLAAEHLYTGSPLTYRINSYNQTNNSTPLRNGLVLGYLNYSENNDNVASNYGASYLFGQYLRCQTKHLEGGGNRIYRTVLEQVGTDYTAILSALSSIEYEYAPESFEELYRNFRMATVLKDSTGPYGFAGESTFSTLAHNAYTGIANLTLKPGAAVVLMDAENFLPENENLSYVAFSDRGDFTYELNAVSDSIVNVTHGTLPLEGATLLAAGYNEQHKLLGVDEITTFSSDEENYSYTLPQGSVIRKFFLFTKDGTMKPLSVAGIQ
ncbi:MAG: hypothetical protein IJ278_00925 [Clostridia bacterium]|nr:hypothetical protein [Clostridia bacterium]